MRKAISESRVVVIIVLFFVADRNECVKEMKRWLCEGEIIVCGRYMGSTFAYQKRTFERSYREACSMA